jgi:hypothetical protein
MAAAEIAVFESPSVRFAYPSNWSCEVEESDEGISVVLQSQGVSFAIVGIYDEDADPEDLVEQAVETLREEHPGLEPEEVDEGDWEDHAGMEVVFMSLDMVSYCWLQSGRVAGKSLLVLMQSIDPESEQSQAVFRAICKSVRTAG